MSPPDPPLAGSRVLSVGHTLPGLFCLAALRDLGAEVVRIERPRRRGAPGPYAGIAQPFPSRSLHAGTHACPLDLKHEAGLAAFRRLARDADLVLEGFRPGVAARLGIDFEVLSRDHPELVYVAISGYGQEGPLAARVGHDLNYLAETGALAQANPTGTPGATFADGLAGLSAALNAVAALHRAARSGHGGFVDVAIVDGPLFLLATELEQCFASGRPRGPGETHLSGRYPWYGLQRTGDGRAVALGAVEPAFHAALCQRLGLDELAGQQFAEGAALGAARAAFEGAFAARTRDEALALCEGADTCASPVRDIAEVAASPLMQRALRAPRDGSERLLRSPARAADPALAPELEGPALLRRLGFGPAEVAALVREGALGSEG